jgi:hypothetical protein
MNIEKINLGFAIINLGLYPLVLILTWKECPYLIFNIIFTFFSIVVLNDSIYQLTHTKYKSEYHILELLIGGKNE